MRAATWPRASSVSFCSQTSLALLFGKIL